MSGAVTVLDMVERWGRKGSGGFGRADNYINYIKKTSYKQDIHVIHGTVQWNHASDHMEAILAT